MGATSDENQTPKDSLQRLLADLDQAKAASMLSRLSERQTQVLEARAQSKTYKEIALSIPGHPKTNEPLSEIYIRKIMASVRDDLAVRTTSDAVIAFMVARSRCDIPVYTETHLSNANDIIDRISADPRIDYIIEVFSSNDFKRLIADSQSPGPKAWRMKFGRYAVLFQILAGIVFFGLIFVLVLLIINGLDANNQPAPS